MGHHLHSTAEVVTPSLSLDNMLVDLAGGDVILPSQGDLQVALVVAQVQIDISAVVEDEHLPRLCGGHGPGIDIHVRVDLDRRDLQANGLEQQARGRGYDALSDATDNTARDEYILYRNVNCLYRERFDVGIIKLRR